LPLIEGDRVELQQVMLNFIVNGIGHLQTADACLPNQSVS
jgi:hypothetical protein